MMQISQKLCISGCTTVENAIYEAMDEWLEEYTIRLASDEQTQEDPVAMALEASYEKGNCLPFSGR